MIGTDRQPTQCTPHREDRGVKDVEPIDLANRGGADADRERARADLRGESCPRVCRELLGIVDAANDTLLRRHDHGARDDGASERPASNFVDAGDEGANRSTQIALDRAPAIAPR